MKKLLVISLLFIAGCSDGRLNGDWKLELDSQNQYIGYPAPFAIRTWNPGSIKTLPMFWPDGRSNCADYYKHQDWSDAGETEMAFFMTKEDKEKLDYFGSGETVVDPNNKEFCICTKDLEKQLYDIYLKEKYRGN